jgi:hypothetical protein
VAVVCLSGIAVLAGSKPVAKSMTVSPVRRAWSYWRTESCRDLHRTQREIRRNQRNDPR